MSCSPRGGEASVWTARRVIPSLILGAGCLPEELASQLDRAIHVSLHGAAVQPRSASHLHIASCAGVKQTAVASDQLLCLEGPG